RLRSVRIMLADYHHLRQQKLIYAKLAAESGELADVANVVPAQRTVHHQEGTTAEFPTFLPQPQNVVSDGAQIGLAPQLAHHRQIGAVEADLQRVEPT